MKHQTIGFELSVSGRDDGTIEAVYIHIVDGTKVHKTREILEDVLLADYAADGTLVGIEVLSPVKISELEKLVKEQKLKQGFRRFVERSAPRELVLA